MLIHTEGQITTGPMKLCWLASPLILHLNTALSQDFMKYHFDISIQI